MITFQQVTLRRGPHILIKNVNWTIYHKQRIGLIGENGCGKTSLFAMLLGGIEPDTGQLDIPRQLHFAHVAQETESVAKSALDFVLDGDQELRALEKELVIAEEQHDGMKIGAIHEKFSIIDAYTAPSRAAVLLSGLGFNGEEQQKLVSEFSGGWRVRLNLAKALMMRSDVLLLDEPTNHLDLDAVLWLEDWLQHYQGTLIMISHDRDFLDKTVDHIAHVIHQQLEVYTGNYSQFETLRAQKLLLQQAIYEKQQKKLTHMQAYVDRFRYKASKAKQAQSRIKAIERMEVIAAVQEDTPFHFEFKKPDQCPNPLITLDRITIAYGDHVVLKNIELSITPNDRIAILGPNGAGKSSFIKVLAGELEPTSGIRTASPGLRIGYFAQHQVDHLNLTESPLEHLQEIAAQKSEVELRKYLGSFGFVGNRVFDPVKNFSGGEKSRLALALIVWQKPNLLLLDEPTNHLDLEMRNALSMALQEYEGAMILVSHDRFLVRTTTDQLLLAAEQKIREFEGDLADYQKWLIEFRKNANQSTAPAKKSELSKKEQRQQAAQLREGQRPLLVKIAKLEEELARLQKKENAVEIVLSDLSLYEPERKAELQTHLATQAEIKKSIEAKEAAWLALCDERDNAAS